MMGPVSQFNKRYVGHSQGQANFLEDLTPEIIQDLIQYVQDAPSDVVHSWSEQYWADGENWP